MSTSISASSAEKPPANRTSRRTVAAVSIGVCVVLAALALWAAPRVSPSRSGPLKSPPNETVNGLSVSSGQAVTWGGAYLRNDTDSVVEILRVDLEPELDEGAAPKIARIEALDPSAVQAGVGTVKGDALEEIPASLRRSPEGYRVDPGKYVNFLVNVTAVGKGKWRFDKVVVTYSIDGSKYLVDLPQSLVLCVDEAGDCPIR